MVAGIAYEGRARLPSKFRGTSKDSPRQGSKRVASYKKTFEWINLPKGRVRYTGGARGRDEPPIETFAMEIFGSIYYGEIKRNFLPGAGSYDIGIVSFGWLKKDWHGTTPDPEFCASFTASHLEEVQALICQAVAVWYALEDKPSFLFSTTSRYTGDIVFQDGWALLRDGMEFM